jgi:branched-subunit amino acid aminotransferase/4-amino-4-deoxychorismate lyase
MTRPAASHVWLDGRLLPSDAAHISVYDRGFQLGDGIFEALRARRGVAIELAGHLARLHGSLAALAFELPFGDEVVAAGIEELLAAEDWDGAGSPDGIESPGDAVIRITVSRGFDPTRDVKPNAAGRATVAIQAWPFAPPSARALRDGERLITSRVHRDADSPISGIKTTSRAELVYARIEAERAGADDAIFLTTDGRLTEATTSNVLLISDDVCATPRLGTALLAGTTRAWLVEHGDAAGLAMVQRDLRLEDVFAAQEMAVCASIGGVIPVTSLDGKQIGDGRPGPRTIAMRAARERWIDEVSIEGARARSSARIRA